MSDLEKIYGGTTNQRLESLAYLADRARETIEKRRFGRALEVIKLMEKIAKENNE